MRVGPLPGRGTARGVAYLFLLLALAVLSVAASASLQLGATAMRRDAEQQLLAVGAEFERALRSYANAPTTGPVPPGTRGPKTLEELLRDPRVPGVRRHLRQVPADPLTGRREWGLERDPQGFIVAVYSLAEGVPIRASEAGGSREGSYRDWKFGLWVKQATREKRAP